MINCHGIGGDYRLEIAETCNGVEEMDDEGSSRWLSMCRKTGSTRLPKWYVVRRAGAYFHPCCRASFENRGLEAFCRWYSSVKFFRLRGWLDDPVSKICWVAQRRASDVLVIILAAAGGKERNL